MTANRIWFVVGVKYIASCSFGKDSTAMVLGLMERKMPLDYVVMFDTGMEFDAIYKLRDRLQPVIKDYGAEMIILKPEYDFLWQMLERPVQKRNGEMQCGYKWCGGMCRWGTTDKLRQINRFKHGLQDDITDYVGIAYDEPKRWFKAQNDGKKLPLVDWKMTEADCLKYCRERGYRWNEGDIDLYDILDRVSCWCCRNKNLKELRNMMMYLPQYWERLKELQRKIDIPFKGEKTVMELETKFRNESHQITMFEL